VIAAGHTAAREDDAHGKSKPQRQPNAGKRHWLLRAVDDEGEVLKVLVQMRRDTRAAVSSPLATPACFAGLKPWRASLMHKLVRKHGFAPETITTDG